MTQKNRRLGTITGLLLRWGFVYIFSLLTVCLYCCRLWHVAEPR